VSRLQELEYASPKLPFESCAGVAQGPVGVISHCGGCRETPSPSGQSIPFWRFESQLAHSMLNSQGTVQAIE